MSDRRTSDATLIAAMRILARDIKSQDGLANACIAEAADRMERLVEERRWVPVGERLPEEGVFVLWHTRWNHWPITDGKRDGNTVDFGGDLNAPLEDVTHWMPLPPGPEGDA